MSEKDAVAWLKEWEDDHWAGQRTPGRSPEPRKTMTLEEWDTITTLGLRFPTVAHNAKWHFGFGMSIYSFPETQWVNEVERICIVNTDHMPYQLVRLLLAETDYDLEADKDLRASREWGWKLFSPVTHTEQKTSWAKMYGLAKPGPYSVYDY
jgi:hypothetical protein